MSRSGVCRVVVVAIWLAAAGCKFPALPDLPEDGGAIDAPDGGPPDATVDAPVRTGPLVANGQAADLVLGQPSFGTNSDRGVTAQSFHPEGLAFDEGRLWITDEIHQRTLGWNSPTLSDAAATYLLGQTTFTASGFQTASATTMGQPRGVFAAQGRIIIPDFGLARTLVWNTPPSSLGQAADLVLGQVDFTSTSSSAMRFPFRGWTDGSRLAIQAGFYLQFWSSFPTTNGAPPDIRLLGSTNVSATEHGSSGVFVDGNRMIIADGPNNRVLIWNTMPTADGQPADIVLGQATFTTAAAGDSAVGMSSPSGVLVVDGALFVSDSGNDRVLVFDPIPTASGATATQVLGQASTASASLDQAPTDRSLNLPVGLAVAGRKLFVADSVNRRVLRYDLALP